MSTDNVVSAHSLFVLPLGVPNILLNCFSFVLDYLLINSLYIK